VDGRTPGADEVDQLVTISGVQMCALGALGEKRSAANRAKGAHGRIDPSGDQLLRTLEKNVGIHG